MGGFTFGLSILFHWFVFVLMYANNIVLIMMPL